MDGVRESKPAGVKQRDTKIRDLEVEIAIARAEMICMKAEFSTGTKLLYNRVLVTAMVLECNG